MASQKTIADLTAIASANLDNTAVMAVMQNTGSTVVTYKVNLGELSNFLDGETDQIGFATFTADTGSNVTANSTVTTVKFLGGNSVNTTLDGSNLQIDFTGTVPTLPANTSLKTVQLLGQNLRFTRDDDTVIDTGLETLRLPIDSQTFSNSSANGSVSAGEIFYDDDFFYVSTSAGLVKKTTITENAAHITWTASANGTSAWNFAGGGAQGTDNETLYVYKGFTYEFNNTEGGTHPFEIRVSDGGAAFTNGISGNSEGITAWTVPQNASGNLVYQCTIHAGMVGTIVIV